MAAAAFVCCCPVRVCFFGCIVKFRNGFARNNPVRHFCNSIPEFSAQILELHWGVSSSLFLLCFPVSFLESSFFSESGVDESSRLSHKHTNQKHTHTTHNTQHEKGASCSQPALPPCLSAFMFPIASMSCKHGALKRWVAPTQTQPR